MESCKNNHWNGRREDVSSAKISVGQSKHRQLDCSFCLNSYYKYSGHSSASAIRMLYISCIVVLILQMNLLLIDAFSSPSLSLILKNTNDESSQLYEHELKRGSLRLTLAPLYAQRSDQLRFRASSDNEEKRKRNLLKMKAEGDDDESLSSDDKWLSRFTSRIKKENKPVKSAKKKNETEKKVNFSIGNVVKQFRNDSENRNELEDKQKRPPKQSSNVGKQLKDVIPSPSPFELNRMKSNIPEGSTYKSTGSPFETSKMKSKTPESNKDKNTGSKRQAEKASNNDDEKSSPIEAITKRLPSFSRNGNTGDKKEIEKVDSNKPLSAISEAWNSVFSDDSKWVTVCAKTDIAPGMCLPISAAGLDLLLIASRDGRKLYCVANECAHFGTPLETGIIQKYEEDSSGVACPNPRGRECITCPLHRTVFDLENGQVVGQWCPHPPGLGNIVGAVKKENKLPTFETRTRGKNIQVSLVSEVN